MTTQQGERTCPNCGKALSGTSQYASQCSACVKERMRVARNDQHVYTRTHVHVWPDGSRTMEMGTTCGCGEAVAECPRAV